MTYERGTPELERPVARLTVTTEAELLPAAVDFVRQGQRRRRAFRGHLDTTHALTESVLRSQLKLKALV